MATQTAFISLAHSAKLKKITSEQEVRAMEFYILQSMKDVLTQKNPNIGKMIFEQTDCLHKHEIESEILTTAEKNSYHKLNTPLLLRRQAFKIILRLLEKKIRSKNLAGSVSTLLNYVNRLEFKVNNPRYTMV